MKCEYLQEYWNTNQMQTSKHTCPYNSKSSYKSPHTILIISPHLSTTTTMMTISLFPKITRRLHFNLLSVRTWTETWNPQISHQTSTVFRNSIVQHHYPLRKSLEEKKNEVQGLYIIDVTSTPKHVNKTRCILFVIIVPTRIICIVF